jgi:hypothetical protein
MRVSKQRAGVWTDEQANNTRKLVGRLEAENAQLRDRALKLASEIRALREALSGDVPSDKSAQHRRQGESVVVCSSSEKPNVLPR